MTIDLRIKEPILRDFDKHLTEAGWKFSGCGPEEKDRQLLEEMPVVIGEFTKLRPVYRDIIEDITRKMGNGMADYCNNAEFNKNGVNTLDDYDLYCHYVAGLVGEGLTRLFVTADLANPKLLERTDLHNSMGLFLQKTNIIRDVHEDWVDKRRFWPKEIWSKHVSSFDDLFLPANRAAAMNCNSEMILNALAHVEDCMFYLAGLREQSIFNFAAIPQVMAIATLDLCFRNPAVFERNVKISKGDACRMMLKTTSVQGACEIFLQYARSIHHKNTTKDPLFLDISIACAKIERWITAVFPPESRRETERRQEEAMLGEAEEEEVPEEVMAKARRDVQLAISRMDARKIDREAQRQELWLMLVAGLSTVFVVTVIMVQSPQSTDLPFLPSLPLLLLRCWDECCDRHANHLRLRSHRSA